MLDPGNVNTGAVHQELASTTTHPPNFFSPQSLENGSEINLQQEVRLKKGLLPVFMPHLFYIPLALSTIALSLSLTLLMPDCDCPPTVCIPPQNCLIRLLLISRHAVWRA